MLEPESDNIADQIADFLDKPTADDTTIVFVAGHGINIDEDYYFIPSDGRKSDPDKWKRSSLVEWADIQKAVERAEGMRFMLLDTCHAANAFNPRLEKDAADARIVVFSATAANSTAAELPELGHGVFTYSVLRRAARRGQHRRRRRAGCSGSPTIIYREVTQAHQCAAEAVLLHQQHGEHSACAAVSRTTCDAWPSRGISPGCPARCSACRVVGAGFARSRRGACPPGDADYPPFYDSSDLFDRAIDKVADYPPSNVRLTGITVPHHLLADRLVALGFRAASGQSYKRIVILTPDHFRKTDKPFATTRRGFETVKGKVATDAAAVSRLLAGRRLDRGILPVRQGSWHPRDAALRETLFSRSDDRAGGDLDPRRPCRLGPDGAMRWRRSSTATR